MWVKEGQNGGVREEANVNGQGKPGSCPCLDEYSLAAQKAALVLAAVSAF